MRNTAKRPDDPMYDSRGTQYFVGAECAYNLSGEVAKGEILSFKWGKPHGTEYWQHTPAIIKIKLLQDMGTHESSFKAGHVSKITGPRSVLILKVRGA